MREGGVGGSVGLASALEAFGEAEQGGEGEFVGAVAAQAPGVGAAAVHGGVDEPEALAVREARVPAGRGGEDVDLQAGAAADLGDQRGEHERVAGVGLERGVEPEPGDAGAVGVEARLGVEQVGQLRRGDAQIAAGEAEERERELVEANVGGVGVDVVELAGEGEQEVGDGRASAGRQAREAFHFRPTLSGFIR